jgi:serine protease Do
MKSRADRLGITRCALFGLLALATLALVPAQATAQARAEAVAKAPAPSLDRLNEDLRALSERVAPSVVQIVASGYSATSATGSVGAIKREQASGSGLAWTADGHIVTNAHVVEGAAAIHVLLRPATTFREGGSILGPRSLRVPGGLVGLDRESDVAVIKVEGQTLAPLELGDSQDLKQGQVVLAFGSPLGLENSMSLGVVSAVARQLKPEDPMIYIQTDAAINPGNSGGPLVDTKGRLVGLNTMILTQSGGNEGIGFAIPSHILTTVANQLVRTGRVHRGWISARAQTVTPTLARGLGLPQDHGVILSDVVPGGPAARAGLRIGDIVLTLDRRPMENARQLEVNLYRFAVGETVTLEVRRGLATFTALVTIVERLEDPDRFAGLVTPERNLIPKLGVLGIEIDSDLRKLLPTLRGEAGVVVASRATFAPSDGPEPGDVIYAVNGVSVRGLSELRAAMDDLRKGDPVVLHVERDSRLRYVALEVE